MEVPGSKMKNPGSLMKVPGRQIEDPGRQMPVINRLQIETMRRVAQPGIVHRVVNEALFVSVPFNSHGCAYRFH